MGITIHYAGKVKSPEAISELSEVLVARAEVLHWQFKLVDQDLKGKFYPSWGHGYGYVPSAEESRRHNIEFFPKMVTPECNGFFRIFDTQYAEGIREGFRAGLWPKFRIDTHLKGIILYPREKCEELKFVFNMKSLELANYEVHDHITNVIYGYNSCWSKTQFAGFRIHVMVCETIRLAEKYVDFSMIKDEAGYYHSRDLMAGIKNFNEMMWSIETLEKFLEEIGKQFGLRATTGGPDPSR